MDVKEAVKARYAGHAGKAAQGCCCKGSSHDSQLPEEAYSGLLETIPSGADLGLGCGNPLALQTISEGETVVDLGSGGGIDCFLAAHRVGTTGLVIGVDMTHAMIGLATRNAEKGGYTNVEFRAGDIEALPVDDETVDLVISNCVINLVPNKELAFAEAFRILRPGGRISVADIVTVDELPAAARHSMRAYVACLGGAATQGEYVQAIESAGFEDIEVVESVHYQLEPEEEQALGAAVEERSERDRLAQVFRSITVQARRPADAPTRS